LLQREHTFDIPVKDPCGMKACQSLCELSRNNNDIPLNKLVVGGTHLDSSSQPLKGNLFALDTIPEK
jgi:hypothetical protein